MTNLASNAMLIPVFDITNEQDAAVKQAMQHYYLVKRKAATNYDPMQPEMLGLADDVRLMVPAEDHVALLRRFDLQGQALFQTSNTAEQLCLQRDQAQAKIAEMAARIANLERQLFDRGRP